MTDDLDNLFDAARMLVQRKYPDDIITVITIRLLKGGKMTLPAASRCRGQEARRFALTANHSPDFRTINWYGTPYKLTATQAAVVRVLWEARDNGTPDVGQHTLLEEAGSESSRLVDLFRRSEA